MTREEEIMERIGEDSAAYIDDYDAFDFRAEDDIRYLLARNEELQRQVIGHKFLSEQRANDVEKLKRRVDHLKMAITGIKEEAAKFASDESVIGYTCIGIYTCADSALAKEQDDD